ncbi:STAS domain-containing protein [Streptomyces sp. NPDC005393]|uniref:STAS domain-containing protein n=1 Tax=Streptomyces sp. NPDC005393 TaxID=3157041 RepID=UPI0033A0029E
MTQQGAPRHAPVPPHTAAPAAAAPDTARPSPDPAPRARTHWIGEHAVVELHGEIDIAGLESVGPLLDAATAAVTPPGLVIVDLRTAAFVDCSGLGLLCRAHRRVAERGGRLRLVCDNPLVIRTLHAGRLLDVLRPVPTLYEALREE